MSQAHDPAADFTLPKLTFLEKLLARVTLMRRGPEQAWGKAIYESDALLAAGLRHLGASAVQMDTYPVFHALDLKDIRILKWALDAGMNPDVLHTNGYFEYPLHRAAARGWLAKVNVLLEAGANFELRDGNGYTPLACALQGWGEKATADWAARKAVALRLIEAGTDVDGWQWNDRESYLRQGPLDHQVLQALLDKGANPRAMVNPKPASNFEALDPEGCLLFRGLEANTPEELGAWLVFMKKHDMDATTLSPHGNTLAGVLIQNPSSALSNTPALVLQELEKHGYDLRASNPDGDTLLHLWARHQSSMFSWWGDALLDLPGMHELAAQPNHAGKTAADVLLDRGNWTTEDPGVMDYVRLLRRAERREKLEAELPVVSEPPAHDARLRL